MVKARNRSYAELPVQAEEVTNALAVTEGISITSDSFFDHEDDIIAVFDHEGFIIREQETLGALLCILRLLLLFFLSMIFGPLHYKSGVFFYWLLVTDLLLFFFSFTTSCIQLLAKMLLYWSCCNTTSTIPHTAITSDGVLFQQEPSKESSYTRICVIKIPFVDIGSVDIAYWNSKPVVKVKTNTANDHQYVLFGIPAEKALLSHDIYHDRYCQLIIRHLADPYRFKNMVMEKIAQLPVVEAEPIKQEAK